ncbi:MAG: shikimate kinase, partial [Acidimicrobiia bacterium]|nr:shikimate kinase [Acidimicrobiia bacterium]
RMGCSIAEFWGENGEEAFRDMEAAAIAQIAAGEECVVATGGGAILRESNVANMRDTGLVVWLQADVETLANRVGNSHRRPLLRDGDHAGKLASLSEERRDAYQNAAHGSVATDGLRLETVATRIEELWNAY